MKINKYQKVQELVESQLGEILDKYETEHFAIYRIKNTDLYLGKEYLINFLKDLNHGQENSDYRCFIPEYGKFRYRLYLLDDDKIMITSNTWIQELIYDESSNEIEHPDPSIVDGTEDQYYTQLYESYKSLITELNDKFEGTNKTLVYRELMMLNGSTFYLEFKKEPSKEELLSIQNKLNQDEDQHFKWNIRSSQVVRDRMHLVALMYEPNVKLLIPTVKVAKMGEDYLKITVFDKDRSPKTNFKISRVEYNIDSIDIYTDTDVDFYNINDKKELFVRLDNVTLGEQSEVYRVKDINYLYSFTDAKEMDKDKVLNDLYESTVSIETIIKNVINSNAKPNNSYRLEYEVSNLIRDARHFESIFRDANLSSVIESLESIKGPYIKTMELLDKDYGKWHTPFNQYPYKYRIEF